MLFYNISIQVLLLSYFFSFAVQQTNSCPVRRARLDHPVRTVRNIRETNWEDCHPRKVEHPITRQRHRPGQDFRGRFDIQFQGEGRLPPLWLPGLATYSKFVMFATLAWFLITGKILFSFVPSGYFGVWYPNPSKAFWADTALTKGHQSHLVHSFLNYRSEKQGHIRLKWLE